MGKHNQNAALGKISDFASSPETPDEKPDRFDRLERIETRLENIEKLLNTVLYAVNDLNESFDKVSKSPAKTTQTQKPKRQQAQKTTQKPTPNEQPSKGKGNSPEQEALRNACEQQVLDFLADGKVIDRREVHDQMPDHEYSKGLMRRALHALAEAGTVKITKTEDMSVVYVSIAKQ